MIWVLAGATGLSLAGPLGALGGLALLAAARVVRRRDRHVPIRPILMVMLVELRSGNSILASLQAAASRFPAEEELARALRVALVSGLPVAVDETTGRLRVLLAQLSRAQASGGSAADAIRRMLDDDIARQRAERLARVRALPVRLMFPIALLILPGVVLLSYGPTVISLLGGLVVPFE